MGLQETQLNELGTHLDHWQDRADLAASFRWTARLNMHEAVANHFSLAVNEDGNRFLINPNQRHFSRIKASDLLLLDANDPSTLDRPNAPDPTAWGLHGSIHRSVPHARCVMHVHQSMRRFLRHWRTARCSQSTKTQPPFTAATSWMNTSAAWPSKKRASAVRGCYQTRKTK